MLVLTKETNLIPSTLFYHLGILPLVWESGEIKPTGKQACRQAKRLILAAGTAVVNEEFVRAVVPAPVHVSPPRNVEEPPAKRTLESPYGYLLEHSPGEYTELSGSSWLVEYPLSPSMGIAGCRPGLNVAGTSRTSEKTPYPAPAVSSGCKVLNRLTVSRYRITLLVVEPVYRYEEVIDESPPKHPVLLVHLSEAVE